MLEYLKEAFWVRSRIPGLGNIPWNVVILVGFLLMGIGHPGFWLIGAALEAAFLTLLATNSRFRNLIEARKRLRFREGRETKRKELIARLDWTSQRRMEAVRKRCRKILAICTENRMEVPLVENSRQALQRLDWLYLKFLLARRTLLSHGEAGACAHLLNAESILAGDLEQRHLTETLRQSKTEALQVTRQRLAHIERREETLAEIDRGLTNIETQLDQALSQMPANDIPELLSGNFDRANALLDEAFYGDCSAEVAAIDATFDGLSGRTHQNQ